jgi:hypothetical protein
MCARGYDGGVPYLGERDMASGAMWALGLAPALLAAAIAAIARSTG